MQPQPGLQSINVVLEGAPLYAVLVKPALGLLLARDKRQDLHRTTRIARSAPGNVLEHL